MLSMNHNQSLRRSDLEYQNICQLLVNIYPKGSKINWQFSDPAVSRCLSRD